MVQTNRQKQIQQKSRGGRDGLKSGGGLMSEESGRRV